MLVIRLSRTGKNKKPSYRLVLQDKRKDPWSKVIEFLGTYQPTLKSKPVNFKKDRIVHWLALGAQASPTVHNLLVDQGIIAEKKVKAWRPKKKETATTQPAAEKKENPT